MKTKKKKKNDRIATSELIKESRWKKFVEILPPEVQRLSLQALDAFDKGNLRRMEQTCDEILKGNRSDGSPLFDVFRILLFDRLMETGSYEKAAGVAADLIAIEEKRDASEYERQEPDVFGDNQDFRGLAYVMRAGHTGRLEHYHFMLADACEWGQDLGRAVDAYAAVYPFSRRSPYECDAYLNGLMAIGREKSADALVDEVIGRYGSPREDGSIAQEDAALVCNAYYLRMLERIQRTAAADDWTGDDSVRAEDVTDRTADVAGIAVGAAHDAETVIGDMARFVRGLNDNVKHGVLFMTGLGSIIVRMSLLTNEEEYRDPFRSLLDAMDSEQVFDREHDEQDMFSDLIPSGYRVLESIDYEKDDRLNRFVAGMLTDLVTHDVTMQGVGMDVDEDSEEVKMARIGILTIKWYLLRFRTEDRENLDEMMRNMNIIANSYPYMWAVIERQAAGLTDDDSDAELKQKMDGLLEGLLKMMPGKKIGIRELEMSMQRGYEATMKHVTAGKRQIEGSGVHEEDRHRI